MFSKVRRSEKGGVLPVFLAALMAVFVATGMLMAVGKGGALRSQAQTAADASALAAMAEIQGRVIALLRENLAPYGTGWGLATEAYARTYAKDNRAEITKITPAGYDLRAVEVTVKGTDRLNSKGPLSRFTNRRADADAIAAIDVPTCVYPVTAAGPAGPMTCTAHGMTVYNPAAALTSVLRKLVRIHLVGEVPPSILSFNTFGAQGDPGGAPPGNVSSPANRELGRKMAAERGWTGEQFNCLDWVYQHESGWNQYADNPTSSAYGIPQALPGSKMSSAGPDWRTNPATQIAWGLDYIAGRYGTPCGAKAFWQAHNWY